MNTIAHNRTSTLSVVLACIAYLMLGAISGAGGARADTEKPVITPGSTTIRLSDYPLGFEYGCTATAGNSEYIMTASHCGRNKGGKADIGQKAYINADTTPIGTVVRTSTLDDLDYSLIKLNKPAIITSTPKVADRSTIKVGDRLCKRGRISGITCGPVTRITDKAIFAKVRVVQGDSGGPAFTEDGKIAGLTSRMAAKTVDGQSVLMMLGSITGATAPMETEFKRFDKINGLP